MTAFTPFTARGTTFVRRQARPRAALLAIAVLTALVEEHPAGAVGSRHVEADHTGLLGDRGGAAGIVDAVGDGLDGTPGGDHGVHFAHFV